MILGLSILVGLHEFGHLIAAKIFGMRVEQYSIGFPPKLFSVKIGETEYSLSAIPLGGFVKISGMVDESLDTDELKEEPKPWEFRAKPAWQRLIVMMGGIIVNVITGIIIFILILFSYGESYLPKEEFNKQGIVAYELGQEIGLKDGDKIVNINGHDFNSFMDLRSPDVLMADNSYYTVLRDGQEVKVSLPSDIIDKLSDKKTRYISYRAKFEVGPVKEGSAAEEAGLKEGDKIMAIEGEPIDYFHEYKEAVNTKKEQTIAMTLNRQGEEIQTEVYVNEKGTIGFQAVMPNLKYAHKDFTFAEAIPAGTEKAFNVVITTVKGLGKLFSGDVSATNSVSGPIQIATFFGGEWIWERFWGICGLLSMVLAFMNFLPIPALDGGHVMFLTYEMISGRAPNDKFMEVAQKVGMVILLSLMVFALGNDFFKVIFS